MSLFVLIWMLLGFWNFAANYGEFADFVRENPDVRLFREMSGIPDEIANASFMAISGVFVVALGPIGMACNFRRAIRKSISGDDDK